MNSSRTDLKIEEKTNEYDNDFIKTNYGVNFKKSETDQNDLIPTEASVKNNSAREIMKIKIAKQSEDKNETLELPQIKTSSPSQKVGLFMLTKIQKVLLDKMHQSTVFMKTLGMNANPVLNLKHSPTSPTHQLMIQR